MYDTPLEIARVLASLEEQPKRIAALTSSLSASRLRTAPGDGLWSLNDVLAHLRSCGDMWGECIARIISEDHPTLRAVNPRKWIESTDYPRLAFKPSFQAYTKQRTELVRLLRSLPQMAWSRRATVTGAGRPLERTVLEYARWLANHERSHLKQIARLAAI